MKIYYWCPFLTNIATIKSVLRSAKSILKNDKIKNIYEVTVLNSSGEWDFQKKKSFKLKIKDLYPFSFYRFLPKGFNFLDYSLYSKEILINIFFQGFVPNIFGLYLTAFAAKSIGTAKASSISAAVPITGAVLGFFILSEIPSFLSWMSLLIVSTGILVVVLFKKSQT